MLGAERKTRSGSLLRRVRGIQAEDLFPWLVGLYGLLAFSLIFHQYFPNEHGKLCGDFAYFLPKLLDGYSWYKANGLWAVPWYTPGFCGGLPMFANPQGIYYSLPQALTIVFNPLTSVYLTLLASTAIGYVGFYLLTRRVFGLGAPAAAFSGAAFMFNGFVVHRLMAGEVVFHSFMLIPLLAYFLLRDPTPGKSGLYRSGVLPRGLLAGVLVSYMFYSGMVNVILTALLATAVIVLIRFLNRPTPPSFWKSSAIGVLVAFGLSASKLVASLHYLSQLPRNYYALPGIPSLAKTFYMMYTCIFVGPPQGFWYRFYVQQKFLLLRPEFEYSVTIIPLLLIGAGIAQKAVLLERAGRIRIPSRIKVVKLLLITAVLCVPIALNYFTPGWNAFLKTIPVIRNSSTMVRWTSFYIPIVVLFSAISLDRLVKRKNVAWIVSVLLFMAIVVFNAATNDQFYQRQTYNAVPVLYAYHEMQVGQRQPDIHYVGIEPPDHVIMWPNNLIAFGGSQFNCYEPMLGYEHEDFPVGRLRPGAAERVRDGVFNMKNPACYVFPGINGCRPGSQFQANQKSSLKAFLHYHPYPFVIPWSQRLADWATAVTFLFLLGYGALAWALRLKRWFLP